MRPTETITSPVSSCQLYYTSVGVGVSCCGDCKQRKQMSKMHLNAMIDMFMKKI